jgi:hypothetical protein
MESDVVRYNKEFRGLLKKPLTSFFELPDYMQSQVKEYVEVYQPNTLSLWGSFTTGAYHVRGEAGEFVEVKEKYYRAKGKEWKDSSDLDLLDCSFSGKRIYKDLEVHGLWRKEDFHKKIIYQDGVFK